ncbi:MAG TPA: cation:proton antiporter [Candidatus Bathyarchaeia archaeon]|nr:cation:proton antiporter [Candidatus Bathyarchaeia archaeon]
MGYITVKKTPPKSVMLKSIAGEIVRIRQREAPSRGDQERRQTRINQGDRVPWLATLSLAQAISLSNLQLARFFLAFVLLLFAAHLFGLIFDKLRLPRVIGEIVGGLLLGPTFLGYLSPSTETWVFSAFSTEGQLLSLVSWFGLILLMFVSGVEIHGTFDRKDKRTASAFLLGATILPFTIGLAVARIYDFSPYTGPNGNPVSLSIIIGIAVAVTSIPVISKIFMDLKIMNTSFARIVLAIATVEDSILYAGLAIATGLAGASAPSTSAIITTIALTVTFLLAGLLVLPRVLRWLSTSRARVLMELSHSRFALFTCFVFVAAAALLNVNIVFGAFLAGIAIGTTPQDMFGKATGSIKKISFSLFTPAYFAIVGLSLDLIHQFDPVILLAFLALSSALKIFGALGVGRLTRKSWLSSTNLALALNARGGPGIVLATVAFGAGLISEPFFVALVLIAIITSLIAGYWLRYVQSRGWPLLEDAPSEQPRLT